MFNLDINQDIKKCFVYTILNFNESGTKYIMFEPNSSNFKQFTNLQALLDYASTNAFVLNFKNGI